MFGLKSVLYENPYLNERKEENINGLTLKEELEISEDIKLDSSEDIINLFKMTPYYYKTSKSVMNKLEGMDSLKTTISFVIRIYAK